MATTNAHAALRPFRVVRPNVAHADPVRHEQSPPVEVQDEPAVAEDEALAIDDAPGDVDTSKNGPENGSGPNEDDDSFWKDNMDGNADEPEAGQEDQQQVEAAADPPAAGPVAGAGAEQGDTAPHSKTHWLLGEVGTVVKAVLAADKTEPKAT
eukprot:jgi/Tetstr1/464806/TSEL_009545.t1